MYTCSMVCHGYPRAVDGPPAAMSLIVILLFTLAIVSQIDTESGDVLGERPKRGIPPAIFSQERVNPRTVKCACCYEDHAAVNIVLMAVHDAHDL